MEAGAQGLSPRERVLFDLARLDHSDVAATLRAVTEGASRVLCVERAGIWRPDPERGQLVSEDVYDRSTGQHSSGELLATSRFPTYMEAVAESRVIAAEDARTDERTRELDELYLRPHRISSILDVPIWRAPRPNWVLCHEHVGPPRHWTEGDRIFATHLADIAATVLEAAEQARLEHRWAATLDVMDEMVFVLDPEGRITQANRAGQRLIEAAGGGVTLSECRSNLEFRDMSGRLLPPQDAAGIRSLRGETVTGELLELFARRTGARRTVRLTSAPVRSDGQVTGAIVVLADVSEELWLDRLKSDILATLAHELKTPLAVTRGYAQLLERDERLPEDLRPKLDAIRRASARMERLSEDLVELTAIQLGRLLVVKAPVRLDELVAAVVERTQQREPRRTVRLSSAGPVEVVADPLRITQALQRLVDNAIRFSPADEEVEVAVEPRPDLVSVVVRDHGIGIPLDRQGRLFEPFFRAHAGTPHDVGGLGIGLFLARAIALRHGGTLTFDSAEGQGSSFRLTLPRPGPA